MALQSSPISVRSQSFNISSTSYNNGQTNERKSIENSDEYMQKIYKNALDQKETAKLVPGLKAEIEKLKEKIKEYDDLKNRNEELSGKIRDLANQIIYIRKLHLQNNSQLNSDPIQQKTYKQDMCTRLCGKLAKLQKYVEEAINDYKVVKSLEETKPLYESYVNSFNDIKLQMIDSKILEDLIKLNANSVNTEEDSKNKVLYIRKINSTLTAFRTCSDTLKNLLLEVHPSDPRLQSSGYFSYFGKVTSKRVFSVPGGDNFIVSEKTNAVPDDWKFETSEAYSPSNDEVKK